MILIYTLFIALLISYCVSVSIYGSIISTEATTSKKYKIQYKPQTNRRYPWYVYQYSRPMIGSLQWFCRKYYTFQNNYTTKELALTNITRRANEYEQYQTQLREEPVIIYDGDVKK